MNENTTYTAFAGERQIISGELEVMLAKTKACIDDGESERILIFDDQTGKQIDFDFRGSIEDVLARLPAHPMFESFELAGKKRTGPGRPKLGVVSKEVTLLPRHWEWLEQQPSRISATLRRIVENEMKRSPGQADVRKAVEAVSNFMSSMAGDLPGYEEASRALFAHDALSLKKLVRKWPRDVRKHVERLSAIALRVIPPAAP